MRAMVVPMVMCHGKASSSVAMEEVGPKSAEVQSFQIGAWRRAMVMKPVRSEAMTLRVLPRLVKSAVRKTARRPA